MTKRFTVRAEIQDGTEPRCIVVQGRDAWALQELVKAGALGCTPIDHPGPRWSGYVHKLRHRHGLQIESIFEQHYGPFAGKHVRYLLRSVVRILEVA